ncbi:D-ribose pyranase [Streptomyces filipinensis]|uniref:D-ribose pyranase n=1 Tax=Streptomyces filipinensis TaxID=66887 RepID=A0A918I6T4_9ACTN|nr:D-ribose pyranase [Streptomyces filipinensis]
MKKAGILNRRLAGAVAELGHGDAVLVCDAGMPVPDGPRLPNRTLLERYFPDLAAVPPARLKELSAGARLVVRTGEARPYADVLLRCGVLFQAAPGPARAAAPTSPCPTARPPSAPWT